MKTISRQEFRADPAAALKKAEQEGALTIVDEEGAPRMTISGQSVPETRKFEGVVVERDYYLSLDTNNGDYEDTIDANDFLDGLAGKRIRITVEVLG